MKNIDNDSFYKFEDKDSIEVIADYTDRCPMLGCRKKFMKTRIIISRAAFEIVHNNIFETISIFVIICNSISLAL